jgi:hypothetical protein
MAMIIDGDNKNGQPEAEAELDFMAGVDGRSGSTRGLPPPRLAVTVGRPMCWPARRAPVAGKSAEALVVRFACSLRADPHTTVQWARFGVALEDAAGDAPAPIASDLFPLHVSEHVEQDVTITVSPHLKFATLEGSLGKAEIAFRVREIRPVVIAWGAQESEFGWDLHPASMQLAGVHSFYALVPTRRRAVLARMMVEADVEHRGVLWHGRLNRLSSDRHALLSLEPPTG